MIASASSLAQKAKTTSTIGADRICSNGGKRMNECGHSIPKLVGRICASAGSIYYGDRS